MTLALFQDGTFVDSFIANIGVDFKIRTLTVEGRRVKLQVRPLPLSSNSGLLCRYGTQRGRKDSVSAVIENPFS